MSRNEGRPNKGGMAICVIDTARTRNGPAVAAGATLDCDCLNFHYEDLMGILNRKSFGCEAGG